MDKNLRYNIDLILIDKASQGANRMRAALGAVEDTARRINTEYGRLGNKLSVVSQQAVQNFKRMSQSVDALGKNFQVIPSTGNPLGPITEGAGRAVPRFNALNNSIQQVAREMPAFAVSMNTGFLAISNNLPILADAISMAKKENDALIASGQKAVPVWKQVAGSLFSWQMALVAGITVLTLYGKDIVDFTKDLFASSDAADKSRKAMEALHNVTKTYAEGLLTEQTNLRYAYDAILKTAEGTAARKLAIENLNKAYGEYMPYLVSEKASLTELATAYEVINSSLRNKIALQVKSAQTDKLIEDAAKKQSEAIAEMQEALADGGATTALSDKIISDLVGDAPKWRSAGDTLREAFDQSIKNISRNYAGLKLNKDVTDGIYDYLKSFYETEGAVEAVNKRVDLLLGKTNQIYTIPEIIVTPDKDKNASDETLNKNLATLGGVTNKINELKAAQQKATGEQQVALTKEIQLWEEKLNLMQRAIAVQMNGNLGNSSFKNSITIPEITGVDSMPGLSIPVEFDKGALQRSWAIMVKQFSDMQKEAEITGQQMAGLLVGGLQNFAQSFGEALASGDGMEVFRSLLLSVMDMLQQFGAALIAAGVATEAFKSLFANPIAGIIAGAALIATVSAAKAALQNATAFADGGIVSGPTYALVGEYSGASNNPEVIAPLDKLKGMLSDSDGTDNGNGEVRFEIRGEVLEGILKKMNHKRNRTR